MFKPLMFLALIHSIVAPGALAATEVADAEALRQRIGVESYIGHADLKSLKIAVLDNGFAGFAPEKGMLPASAELVKLTQIPPASSPHGLGMAQIIWALTGKSPDGPKFYLVTTNGFTNFKAAVDFVISNKIDIVLYSQVWSFGSNFDGTGFINALVSKAVKAGVLWINAAGNNHGLVYGGFVERQKPANSPFLTFGDGRDYLRFTNKLDENDVTVTLSWSDFKDSETYNTTKDLDLYVYNEAGKLVGSSELIQKGQAPDPNDPASKLSSHAREVAVLSGLDRGEYRIKIKVSSTNFEAKDRFRVLLKSEKDIDFVDSSPAEDVMAPADNPDSLTVGERQDPSSSIGPTADGRMKPDVLIDDARISFTNGTQVSGSSNAAALFAGTVALMKATVPGLDMAALKRYLSTLPGSGNDPSIPADLQPSDITAIPVAVQGMIPTGSRIMKSIVHGHAVVLTEQDPFQLPAVRQAGLSKSAPGDALIYSPDRARWLVLPVAIQGRLRPPFIEFRAHEAPKNGSPLWSTPAADDLRKLHHDNL